MEKKNYTGAIRCANGMYECQETVVLWTVGINGVCHEESYGVLIGEGGYTSFWMEVGACSLSLSLSPLTFL